MIIGPKGLGPSCSCSFWLVSSLAHPFSSLLAGVSWETACPQMGSMAAQVPRNQRDTGAPPFASGAPDYRQSRGSCVGPWAPGPGSLCPLSWSLSSQPSQSWQPPGKGPWLGRVTRVTHAGGEGTAHKPSALIANPLHPQATSQRDKWFIEADLGAGWLRSHSGWGRFHYPGKQHQICG